MHTNGISNVLNYINNHVNSCMNCMLLEDRKSKNKNQTRIESTSNLTKTKTPKRLSS